MKQTNLLFLLILFFSLPSYAQLDKGTWFVGRSGTFTTVNDEFSSSTVSTEYTRTYLQLNPSVGYIIKDKFATGIKTSFSWTRNKGLSDGSGKGVGTATRADYGPFIRYYFLDKEKQFNILTDLSYQFGHLKLTEDRGTRRGFSAMAGSVIYFNSSVGLELLMGYKTQREEFTSSNSISNYIDKKKLPSWRKFSNPFN